MSFLSFFKIYLAAMIFQWEARIFSEQGKELHIFVLLFFLFYYYLLMMEARASYVLHSGLHP